MKEEVAEKKFKTFLEPSFCALSDKDKLTTAISQGWSRQKLRPKILKKLDSQCERWGKDQVDDSSSDEDDLYGDSFGMGDDYQLEFHHEEDNSEGRRLENDHKFLY